jgi:Predicted transcriptional regulators
MNIRYKPQFADAEEYSYVGPFIAHVRHELDISQAQVSEATGFSIQSISRFENGKTSPATVMGATVIDYVLGQLQPERSIEEVMDMFDEFCYEFHPRYLAQNSNAIVDS